MVMGVSINLPDPPTKAVSNGHKLVWDPPGMSSAQRWTCELCGRTALRSALGKYEYGSAIQFKCDQGGGD